MNCSWRTAPWWHFDQVSVLYPLPFHLWESYAERPCVHLGTCVLHPSSCCGCRPVSATETGIHCDPRRICRSNNTPTLGTSSVCWIMQAWCNLVGRLGYQLDVGILCWGSVPKISAADLRGSRCLCLFFVAVYSAGNPSVFAVPSTAGVVGVIVPFLVVVLASWMGRAWGMPLLTYITPFFVAVAPTYFVYWR